jgi:Ca-activated chloride channel family protein
MWHDFHLLRPWWLLAYLPWIAMILWRHPPKLAVAWEGVCDAHLLPHLLQQKTGKRFNWAWVLLLASLFFMILSCTGPAFIKLASPTYKAIQPKVLLLDMSSSMQEADLSPNRLSRAKFVIQDLLNQKETGQWGLSAFTGEPFVVSPLTDDGKTINALLPMLTADIMPVDGQQLDSALQEAQSIMKAAGDFRGQILVFTADVPSNQALSMAKDLANQGIQVSIMPMIAQEPLNPLFQGFAEAGKGEVISYRANKGQLQGWLQLADKQAFSADKNDEIPLWRDEGRWFLIPALLCLLALFQRGRLQEMGL